MISKFNKPIKPVKPDIEDRPVRRCERNKCNSNKPKNETITSYEAKKVSPPKPGGLIFSGSDLEMIQKTFKATKLHRVIFFYDSNKKRIIFLTDNGIYDGNTRKKIDMLPDIEAYTKMEV